MNLFIKRLINFISIIILFLLVIEILFKKIPNDYSYKNILLTRNINNVEVLVLGSQNLIFRLEEIICILKNF